MSYALARPAVATNLFEPEPYLSDQMSRELTHLTENAAAASSAFYSSLSLSQRFRFLADWWAEDVQFQSSPERMIEHPAYSEIIGLGPIAIPLLLRELEVRPHYWFAALRTLTGADPVQPQSRGYVDRMAAEWLRWGQGRGIRW